MVRYEENAKGVRDFLSDACSIQFDEATTFIYADPYVPGCWALIDEESRKVAVVVYTPRHLSSNGHWDFEVSEDFE